jgi:hypothetical protein
MAEFGNPIMDSMIQQKLLENNVFAFYMAMNEQDSSELLFGKYDSSKFNGNIEWHPVINLLFWSLNLEDVKYNGVSMGLC